MVREVQDKAKKRMHSSIEAFRNDLAAVRTGRASLSLLDGIRVDYYGTPTALSQVANMGVPEGNLITVTPWDPQQLGAIEKAILKANIGLTPNNDGKMLRVPVPPLTEDRRKEFAKRVSHLAEEGRTVIRGIRREANDEIKKLEKDKQISQDEAKAGLKAIQDLTDEFVARIDELSQAKEKEVLEF